MTNLSGINLNNGSAVGAKREGTDSLSHSLALMPKYESYKESGAEWLGEIPDNWELISLKRLLKFHTGGTPPSGNQQFYDGDLPWITIADLNERFTNRHHCLSRLGVRQARIPLTPKGSLLYSFKLSIGQVAFASTDIYTNEAIASFIPRDNLNLNYYYYALPIFLENNAAVNIYGAKLLNQDLIKNAWILKLDDDEQTLIANFLDNKTAQIDDAIAIKEQQISLLKERKQIIIQQAVTQGLDPNVPMKDSGVDWIGKIPAHWETKKLRYLSTYFKGFAFKSEDFTDIGVPIVKASNIKEHAVVDIQSFIAENNQKSEFERFRLYSGDVIISTVGSKPDVKNSAVGQLCSVGLEYDRAYLNQNTVCIRPNESLDKRFLKYVFASKYVRNEFDRRALWIANQAYLEVDEILDVKVSIPKIAEQSIISDYLDLQMERFTQAIEKQQMQIEKLKEYKTTLINSAVTGKIKITPEMIEQ